MTDTVTLPREVVRLAKIALEDATSVAYSDAYKRRYTDAIDTLRAALDAPAAPQAVPEGWQLVPITPRRDMQHAGSLEGRWSFKEVYDIYIAMLAAAPIPKDGK